MKIRKNHENGVALIFALGMLSLLMLLGMAFVSNALIAQKVAANNSSRTQARMLAQSALSRVMASVMIYQQQAFLENKEVESFNGIISYNTDDNKDKDSDKRAVYRHGELKEMLSHEMSLWLPEDNSVVDKATAIKFNELVAENNQNRWVYFYNNTASPSDKKIIGRAAWQAITVNPQILAPMVFRGHLDPDFDGTFTSNSASHPWRPRDHRWGRDIDELFFDSSTALFDKVADDTDGYKGQGGFIEYDNFVDALWMSLKGADDETTSLNRRWFERWFIPDKKFSSASNYVYDDSTMMFPEVYTFKRGNDTKELMRFNISEFSAKSYSWVEDYFRPIYGRDADGNPVTIPGSDAVEKIDKWYARFGINTMDLTTEKKVTVKDVNSYDAIDWLSEDSVIFLNDEYDYKINADDRPGLPFLRRIGSSAGTFSTGKRLNVDISGNITVAKNNEGVDIIDNGLAKLRQQVSANFNDYSDADSMPTSDVPASQWNSVIPDDTSTAVFYEPSFTGNEATPYLYELGFQMGLHKDSAPTAAAGLRSSFAELAGGNIKFDGTSVKLSPIVKLANIYGADAYKTFTQYDAAVDPGKVEIKFRSNKITVTISGSYQLGENTISFTDKKLTIPDIYAKMKDGVFQENADRLIELPEVTFSFGEAAFKAHNNTLAFTAEDLRSGTAPDFTPVSYPLKKQLADNVKASSAVAAAAADITYGTLSDETKKLHIDLDFIKKYDANTADDSNKFNLPAEATNFVLTSSSVEVNEIFVTSVNVKPRRVVLMAKQASAAHSIVSPATFGVDYVRSFAGGAGFTWKPKLAEQDKALTFGAGTLPGVLLGNVCNYDPRQNLNNGDWELRKIYEAGTATDYTVGFGLAADYTAPSNIELAEVMRIDGDTGNGLANSVDSDMAEIKVKFDPSIDAADKDNENVSGPAWTGSGHLSTAFIRNAPMMSPWEIGFIHRGVRWQTINIKNAVTPGDSKVDGTKSCAHGGNWEKAGTSYSAGDGMILEQIKMSDRCMSYGKINVNMLNSASGNADAERDKNIAFALFNNIKYKQPVKNFYAASTRANDKEFPTAAEDGSTLNFGDSEFTALSDSSKYSSADGPFISRADFLNRQEIGSASLENAFGAASDLNTDAAQEEIIGKTINLLSASSSSPIQVKVLIVAQTIKDIDGMQYKLDKNNNDVELDCSYGIFDVKDNIYFDEITGEVKMLVTLDRDLTTGRVSVRKIDYIE